MKAIFLEIDPLRRVFLAARAARAGPYRASSLLAIALLAATPALAGINRWTSHGPPGQYAAALAIDPMQPATLYAGTGGDGVFKSSDRGASWSALARTSSFSATVIGLAIVPSDPTILYAGLSYHSGLIPNEAGVVKSTDGGAHWSPAGLQTWAVGTIAIDPTSASTVYAGTAGFLGAGGEGIQESTDGGKSWNLATDLAWSISSLVFDPKTPSTLYASGNTGDVDYPDSGVIRSKDGGRTWDRILLSECGSVRALAVDPTNTSTLYAGQSAWLGVNGCRGILKSTDGGGTWNPADRGLGNAVSALAIDPVRPRTLYAGTDQGVFRSGDGGGSWAPFSDGLTEPGVNVLVIERSGAHLHAGTRSGVFDFEVASALLDISAAQDGSTRFFSFDVTSGQIVLGSVDSSRQTTLSEPYGPFAGWTPRALAAGEDGVTRILWTHEDGAAALWRVAPLGDQVSFRYEAITGLAAVDVAAGSGSETHVLWTGADGSVRLQTIDGSGAITSQLSLGPYAGWSATDIADGPDGFSRLLWNNRDGRVGLSLVSSDGILRTARYDSEVGWTALDVAVGGDGLTRILRASEDGRAALRVVDAAGEVTADGPISRAPAGMTARRIASGPDGSSRILFTEVGGNAALVFLSAAGAYEGVVPLTPSPSLPAASTWTGTFDWVSATATRPLCPEITGQIGSRFSLWIGMKIAGPSVTLLLSEGPPSNDPLDEGPAVYTGTIIGDFITASDASLAGGFGCPADKAITRETGGDFTATVSGDRITGEYTTVYGYGADAVTFLFRFNASRSD